MKKVALIIPVYEPDVMTINFLKCFKPTDFDYFIIVNDGSGEKYKDIFKKIEENKLFKIIGYDENHGKGFALKYGFDYVINLDSEVAFFVTADGDGQHVYQDILRVKEKLVENENALVLGTRVFDKKSMPLLSKIGNYISKTNFKIFTKKDIKDTQTGLRGIPSNLFSLALNTKGDRYDYEATFLMDALNYANLVQVDIKSVYINNNEGSHFKPLKDTILINKNAISYILLFITAFILDIGLFATFKNFVFNNFEYNLFISIPVVRIISASFYFTGLYLLDKKDLFIRKIPKYIILFVVYLGLSIAFSYLLSLSGLSIFISKLLADIIIIFLNFLCYKITEIIRRKKTND